MLCKTGFLWDNGAILKKEVRPMEQATPAIILKMQSMMDAFTKSEQRVIRVILQNPQEVIYGSVAELALRSDASAPTVIRACKKLGLSGYQDLKITLAKDLVNPLQSINEDVSPEDDCRTVTDKVFQSTVRALQFTHDTLNIAEVDRAVKALLAAERIVIIGMGNSRANACDLEHKLLRLGRQAQAFSDPHMATLATSYLGEKDVLFCISHSGSSREVVDLAAQAAGQGVRIICLTNIGISPLSKLSHILLHTASTETHYRIIGLNSRIAQLAIIDTLYTLLALQTDTGHSLTVERAMQSHKY